MPDLKLARLPDRTPVKLTVNVSPRLLDDLKAYAAIYRQLYGDEQHITDLVPPMLAAFLASDRGFAKARETLGEQRK